WAHYYVHEYRIEQKIDNGSWSNIATITSMATESYVDEYIIIPDPRERTIYYRMRGKVFDTYSDYTDEKIPAENQERMLPKRLANDNMSTESLPDKFELLANYPNPFNSTTAIRFQLPHDTQVSLKIFNIHGEDFRTSIGHRMQPGMQQVEWDGTDYSGRKVASGIYIYQLIAGEFKQAHKMTLVY
ncbi:MAG TPA: FlgD immunoglobulin-like domain containing protein, partial [bacterium]